MVLRSVDECGRLICAEIGISLSELRRGRRTPHLASQRLLVYAFLNKVCGFSSEETAEFCAKDGSTIRKALVKKEHIWTKYNKQMENLL